MNRDAEEMWTAYYARMKQRRLSEATKIWSEMQRAGISAETTLALDFSHFASQRADAESLAAQLSENYEIEVSAEPQSGYWFVNGTTRPYGVSLDEEQHKSWVEFMADVARSHSCVFASWVLEAPALGRAFRSEDIEPGRE